jgi:uncharacterized membrane protein YgcG
MSRRQRWASTAAIVALLLVATAAAAQNLPRLTAPVNDFAGVVGRQHAETMDRRIRALQAQTGDAVVVVTTRSTAPFGDIREYAVKLFENHGAGLGAKGQDNGVLVVLAVDERRVWIEVGYGLEPFITDGFAGEVSRTVMVPSFRQGDFGGGLQAGVDRLIAASHRGGTSRSPASPSSSRHPGRAPGYDVPAARRGVHPAAVPVGVSGCAGGVAAAGAIEDLERVAQRRRAVRRGLRRRLRVAAAAGSAVGSAASAAAGAAAGAAARAGDASTCAPVNDQRGTTERGMTPNCIRPNAGAGARGTRRAGAARLPATTAS